ncbi:hypothetical protein AB0F68_14160 [Micromonospora sp. NPDC023966]|uniref:hypothetical protein n=1 Tax=Micromonospora sp. NPDC023966 TaxID=3154699 RepID=UPI0033F51FAF
MAASMPSHRASRCPRPLAGQLHRFIGNRSGRKSQYATLLADALGPARTPAPLDRLLALL